MLTTNFHTRALTLVLQERDWRALREAEPDPVGWLKEQVRERLATLTDRGEPASADPHERGEMTRETVGFPGRATETGLRPTAEAT